MARLIVSALSEDTAAAPENTASNYIIVSVTDANGVPIADLGPSNFQAQALVVGPGGAATKLDSMAATPMAGIYRLNVVPIAGTTWKSGVYIFGVAVTHGADRGQALASVQMD